VMCSASGCQSLTRYQWPRAKSSVCFTILLAHDTLHQLLAIGHWLLAINQVPMAKGPVRFTILLAHAPWCRPPNTYHLKPKT